MGLLDATTIFDWDGPNFGVGRRGHKLLKNGEATTAVIVGIKVTSMSIGDGSNDRHYAYALDVQDRVGAPVRLGCRQFVNPHRKLVGLGSQVQVRRDKDDVIIDWAATLQQLGATDEHRVGDSPDFWKPLGRKAPDPGVDDIEQSSNRKRIASGRAAHATVLRINGLGGGVFGGSLENVDVDVLLTFDDDGSTREALVRRLLAPDYAHSLLTVGAILPVGVDKDGDRVTIDWLAAANGDLSHDPSPPASTRDLDAVLPPTTADKVGGALGGVIGNVLASAGMTDAALDDADAVDFDTFVNVSAGLARECIAAEDHDAYAQRHGVAPDTWAAASQAWQVRMAKNWKLGAKYGSAYAAAYQRGDGSGMSAG